MKFVYTIVIAFCLLIQSLSSQEIDLSSIPPNLGANNWGTEFYLTFVPVSEYGTNTDRIIYITSNVKTKVTVEIKGKEFQLEKYTVPNEIIEFKIPSVIASLYRKSFHHLPEPDQVWADAAVHITAEAPVICYAATKYEYESEAYLALPVHTLGKDYIVSSYNDASNNKSWWSPSYTGIIAAHDKTKVRFTMGGNDSSSTVSGQKTGEQSNWNLNAGDVLLFGSFGENADLTGSKIMSTKPVAVVSGNFCAYVPTNCGCCDILEEMEMPTQSWGKEYHVTAIVGRKKSSIIRVFAKDSNTTVYRDGEEIGFIQTPGGIQNVGWFELRANEGEPKPITISGDKPISVTQYNTGQQDDNEPSDPFQMNLVAVEQYQKEFTFFTQQEEGSRSCPNHYVNLIYEARPNGEIPHDLEFAEYNKEDSTFVWHRLMDYSPNPGIAFAVLEAGKRYNSKIIELATDGVYKFRAANPIQVYQYGFTSYDSYGLPATAMIKDLSIKDTLPPEPEWTIDCRGNVNSGHVAANYVTDKPDDDENRSNLGMILMHSNLSYNYMFDYSEYIPGEDETTSWSLETIDPSQDARAVVQFIDAAGNDTILIINYDAANLSLSEDSSYFGRHWVGEDVWKEYFLFNEDTIPRILTDISLKDKTQGFSIWDESQEDTISFPVWIAAEDTLHFWVKFQSSKNGTFSDSIGYGDSCKFYYYGYMEADVGFPVIDASDWNFPSTNVQSVAYGQFDVRNIGPADLKITGYYGMTSRDSASGKVIFRSLDFEELNISEDNPLVLNPGQTRTFEIEFRPLDSLRYDDSIVFFSNSANVHPDGKTEIDSVARFPGEGILEVSVGEYNDDFRISISPNPVRDYLEIKIENLTPPSPIERDFELNIYDVLGQSVLRNTPSSLRDATPLLEGNNRINISYLPSGIYFVRVGSEIVKFMKI